MPVKLTLKEFIKRARVIHGCKYDYSKVIYIDSKTKIIIICPIHGEFEQLPDSHLRGSICWKCGIEKRSISNSTTHEKYILKVIELYGDKFDLSKTIYKHSRDKLFFICKEHGEFKQRADLVLLGHGCQECSNKIRGDKLRIIFSSNTNKFIEQSNLIHFNFYNYSNVKYKNNHSKVCITCPIHGEFWQTPNAHLNGQGCPSCKSSKGELALEEIFKKYNIEAIPQYNIPEIVANYEIDFYLPEYRLLIEFHGRQHYEYIPFFHDGKYTFEDQKTRDELVRDAAIRWKYNYLEFNYKQLKHLSSKQFEEMVLSKIKNIIFV